MPKSLQTKLRRISKLLVVIHSLICGRILSVDDFRVSRTDSIAALSRFSALIRGLASMKEQSVKKKTKSEAARENCIVMLAVVKICESKLVFQAQSVFESYNLGLCERLFMRI